MFFLHHKTLLSVWFIFKGALVATVTLWVLGTTFIQSVVIATLSGTLGIIGMAIAAYIASTEARKNRELLHDIKKNTDTDKREGDTVGAAE